MSSSTSKREPAIVACKGFTDAKPLFFRWDGKRLSAGQHNALRGSRAEIDEGGQAFEIGDARWIGSKRERPWVILKGNDPPVLTFAWGDSGPSRSEKSYGIRQPGIYVTLGDMGIVRILRPSFAYDNSQAEFLGDEDLAKRFGETLLGHCFNPSAELFHRIDGVIYRYSSLTGMLMSDPRGMSIGTSVTFSENNEMGNDGGGAIEAYLKRLDGMDIVTTHHDRSLEGLCLGVIPIEEDGLYTTVTPEIVLRLAPNPAMLFSQLEMIQHYNAVFNADWYKKQGIGG